MSEALKKFSVWIMMDDILREISVKMDKGEDFKVVITRKGKEIKYKWEKPDASD